eukprot:12227985-Alexandrium_andersonii.AAC.1
MRIKRKIACARACVLNACLCQILRCQACLLKAVALAMRNTASRRSCGSRPHRHSRARSSPS